MKDSDNKVNEVVQEHLDRAVMEERAETGMVQISVTSAEVLLDVLAGWFEKTGDQSFWENLAGWDLRRALEGRETV